MRGDRIAVIPTNQGGVGIILLSIVSFSADGLKQFFKASQYPDLFAETHAIKFFFFFFFFFLASFGCRWHPPWLVAEQAHMDRFKLRTELAASTSLVLISLLLHCQGTMSLFSMLVDNRSLPSLAGTARSF